MFDFSEVKNYDPELAEAMENELTCLLYTSPSPRDA